jgi:hypothetical protein
MKLLRDGSVETDGRLAAALACCVAHRCIAHQALPPLNLSEGNGSSECGVCAAEDFGTRLAEQALDAQHLQVIVPILEGYAARLDHHAVLKERLAEARTRLELLSPGAGVFLDDVLDAG